MKDGSRKSIILHGFTQEEALGLMRIIKGTAKEPRDLIFAMSTPNSLEMKLRDIIEDLEADHAYFLEQKKGE